MAFRASPGGSGDAGEAALAARAAARRAREAADARVLAGDAHLAEVLARLDAALDDLNQLRWAARGPQLVRAGVRAIARRQARLDAAGLRLLADVDGRDDVIPRAKPKTAAAAFLRSGLGLQPAVAARQAETARLLTGPDPDLARVGAAYAAGDLSRGHLDLAVGVHRRLGAIARQQLLPDTDTDAGQVVHRRAIELVDAVLAERARHFTVPEFARIANRIVQTLNPPTPEGAHQRRYLHLSPLPDGSLLGRFGCGPAQALKLTAAIAALDAPRPGKAIDADGIERDLPDERTNAQRRMDALTDIIDQHPCADHLHNEHAPDNPPDPSGDPSGDPDPGQNTSQNTRQNDGNDDRAPKGPGQTGTTRKSPPMTVSTATPTAPRTGTATPVTPGMGTAIPVTPRAGTDTPMTRRAETATPASPTTRIAIPTLPRTLVPMPTLPRTRMTRTART